MRQTFAFNPKRVYAVATLTVGWLLMSPALGIGQNYGSQFYSYTNFPGENWPADPVPATSVSIGNPTGIATDAAGNVYIAGPSIIFKLDTSGMLTHIAGDGRNGYSGDGGAAADAELGFPLAVPYDIVDWGDAVGNIAVDSRSVVYIADMFNNRIRKITPDGIISTVAGNGDSAPFNVVSNDGRAAQDAQLWVPSGVSTDATGSLYVADGSAVWQVTPGGLTRLIAGNDCGHHEISGVCAPTGLAVDTSGNVYVADSYCRVRKIASDGTITTVAGDERPSAYFNFTCGYSGDNGPATTAAMSIPYGVAVDAAGNLYIADTYNNRIRKVFSDGTIATIAGSDPPVYGSLYPGGYSGDGGPATSALLKLPHAVAVDAAGNIYIADTGNFVIRKVTSDGIITTVAGNRVWCCSR